MKAKSIFSALLVLIVLVSISFYGFNTKSTPEKACVGFGVLLLNAPDCRCTVYVVNVSSGNIYYLTGGYGGNPSMFYGCPQEYGIFNVVVCCCNMHGGASNISFYSPSGAYVEITLVSGECMPD